MTKSFALQAAERAMQLLRLLTNDVRPKIAITAASISLVGELLGQVQNDGNGKAMKLPRERNQRLARLGLYVGRVHNCQLSGSQTLTRYKVQHLKSIFCGCLIVLVI